MKIKIITDSKELEQFTSREDITISKIDIKSCEQSSFTQQYFVAVVMYEENTGDNFDWQSFRNQAAKDIMCAMIIADEGYIGAAGLNTHLAIDIADDLISKLKEKEKE